jgi:hypothetical protein
VNDREWLYQVKSFRSFPSWFVAGRAIGQLHYRQMLERGKPASEHLGLVRGYGKIFL